MGWHMCWPETRGLFYSVLSHGVPSAVEFTDPPATLQLQVSYSPGSQVSICLCTSGLDSGPAEWSKEDWPNRSRSTYTHLTMKLCPVCLKPECCRKYLRTGQWLPADPRDLTPPWNWHLGSTQLASWRPALVLGPQLYLVCFLGVSGTPAPITHTGPSSCPIRVQASSGLLSPGSFPSFLMFGRQIYGRFYSTK